MKSKHNFKCIVFCVIFIFILLIVSILYNKKGNPKPYSSVFYSMDTVISVETYGLDLTKEIQSKVEELNQIFDRHSEGTQMYSLNQNKILENPSIFLNDLVTKTLELNQKFGYNVDITSGMLIDTWNITSDTPKIPTNSEISQAMKTIGIENISINGNEISLSNDCILDFGSVAKGYTLDILYANLTNYNIDSAYISMGSSTLLYGTDNYNISIRSPNDTNGIACKFSINGTGFISTSGGYERYMEIDGVKYSHILDLSTGYPTDTDLTSVTVYTDSGLKSDFLSTYIYLGGTENIYKYLNCEDFKTIAIDNNNNLYVSNGLDIQIEDNSFKVVNTLER